MRRITEDRESGLPRYYYNTVDQYFSPVWSPDGRELLAISNRGHIWGSGGFWRFPARSGGEPRDIHFEETTWKAHPDWSRDGKRIVYSSYLGRQWHQLWLMTATGEIRCSSRTAISMRLRRDGRPTAGASPTSRMKVETHRSGS